jgi:hypothetical protein
MVPAISGRRYILVAAVQVDGVPQVELGVVLLRSMPHLLRIQERFPQLELAPPGAMKVVKEVVVLFTSIYQAHMQTPAQYRPLVVKAVMAGQGVWGESVLTRVVSQILREQFTVLSTRVLHKI